MLSILLMGCILEYRAEILCSVTAKTKKGKVSDDIFFFFLLFILSECMTYEHEGSALYGHYQEVK